MKKLVRQAYLSFLIFIILLFLYMLVAFRLNRQSVEYRDDFRVLTPRKEAAEEDRYSPVGFREVYALPVEEIEGAGNHLVFLTIHQEVKVYAENVCIYYMRDSEKNKFGRTPGCVWNDVLLNSGYAGSDLRIEIVPVYYTSVGTVPEFYLGTRYSIVRKILMDEGLEFLMAVAAVVLGIVFIVYVFFNAENSEVDRGLAWMGAVSIALGLWKASDGGILKLLLPKFPAVSLLPFVALMVGVMPLFIYLKEMYSTKEHWLWYLFFGVNILEMVVCIVLQYLDIRDFREMFVLIIAVIAIGFIVFLWMFIHEVRVFGWDTRLLRRTLGVSVCFLAIGLDVGAYSLSGGTRTTVLGMLIFLGYIVMQGFVALDKARELTMIGMRAQNYENMAYHDQLTGLFNRSALAEDTDPVEFDPDKSTMIVFDLNDLKKCNDSLGHDKGDIYIRDSAKLIRTVFQDFGRCYRTGGDEFCCLVRTHSLDSCKKQVELLRQQVAEYNKKGEIHMAIAVGYAMFDRRIDYSLNDTAKRADILMYKDKERLKRDAAENKTASKTEE